MTPNKLPLGPDEFALSFSRVRALSLFEELPPRMEGRLQGAGGRGAVVLRRLRAGDVICRQGDPGWTAYFLVGNEDLIVLRESHLAKANSADRALASKAPELLALSGIDRRRKAEQMERDGGDRALTELVFASAGRPEEGELEALYAERAILAAGQHADAALAAHHPSQSGLDVAARLRHAEAIEGEDVALAGLLRASAQAAEHRVRVAVSVGVPVAARPEPRGPVDRIRALLGLAPRPRDHSTTDAAARGDHAERVVATLYEGELVGELSCLYHAPRSHTVRVLRDCYAIEVLGHVLQLLLASPAFQEQLDATYRSRVLSQALRSTPVFARAPDAAIELIRRQATLVSCAPGQILFHEGDASDSLYLVRSGTLRLTVDDGSAEPRVLGYRSAGNLVGGADFLGGERRGYSCSAFDHPRDATRPQRKLPPQPRVQVVRIDREPWTQACALYPPLPEELLRESGDPHPVGAAHPGAADVDALGLLQGRKLMLLDVDRCTGCADCVRACADVHDDHVPRLALAGPRIDGFVIPTSCRSCADPVCLVGCPVGAIHTGAARQIVIESWCIACGLCAAQCPYGAIELRPTERGNDRGHKIAVTCDQCAALPGGPRCVSACAHEAAFRVDAPTFFSNLAYGKLDGQ